MSTQIDDGVHLVGGSGGSGGNGKKDFNNPAGFATASASASASAVAVVVITGDAVVDMVVQFRFRVLESVIVTAKDDEKGN